MACLGEGAGEVHTGCWRGDLKKGNHLEDVGVDWTIILKWICKKRDEFAGTSLICQWIGMDGRVF